MGESEKVEKNQIVKAYAACRDALVRSLLKMRARQEDVDDILQETFLRAMDANQKTRIQSPRGYLFSVSRNLVLEKLSLESREITMEIDDALLEGTDVDIDRDLHYRRKFQQFKQALSALPENKRRAILLRKFYGLSHREIAKKMNVSISSVEKYIASGIKQCKRSLTIQGYEFDSLSSEPRDVQSRSNEQGRSGKAYE